MSLMWKILVKHSDIKFHNNYKETVSNTELNMTFWNRFSCKKKKLTCGKETSEVKMIR